MGRLKPRFRISIKDFGTGSVLRLELVEQPFSAPRHYWLRVNGRKAREVPEASLTTVFHRLRKWLVKQQMRTGSDAPGNAAITNAASGGHWEAPSG